VDPGVKVNGDYYNNVLLRQGLLRWNARTKNASAWFFWNTVNFVRFSVIQVLQGSVATYVRCGGISTSHCIANVLLSLAVKEFLKSVKIWQSYGQNLGPSFFFGTRCINTYHVFSCSSSVVDNSISTFSMSPIGSAAQSKKILLGEVQFSVYSRLSLSCRRLVAFSISFMFCFISTVHCEWTIFKRFLI